MNSTIPSFGSLSQSLDRYLSRQVRCRNGNDALARQLSLLFSITCETSGPEEIEQFDRIFNRLVDEAAIDTRAFLSVQFSVAARAPRTTIRRLARDVIEVARPILVHSPHLDDADLIAVAVDAGLAHMAAIAERAELSVVVTDILVRRGDDDLRRKVAANHGALLSGQGFRRLSEQARTDARLEGHLVEREDLPAIVVRFLVRHGTGKARECFATTGTLASGPVRREESLPADFVPRSVASWLAIYDFDAAEARVAAFADHGQRGEPLLLRFVAEERFPEAAVLVARMLGVGRDAVVGWLTDADPQAFLVAARTLPLQVRTVSGLLNIGPWRQGLNGRTRQCAIRSYQALPIEACRQRLAALSRVSGPAGLQPPDDRRDDRLGDRGCALDADWWSPDPSPAGA
ncbi:DUF2336 domain-containing protein [Prosthecomicrobium hirschii]|uniref:DUF2336 domain-containing protein n=1 Tax=Prosthecodimorpha hirschii TaxID=665126 RepID=UPI00221E883F|nr:DUF2336 domain-containing protein [Prosthecomicrobium hirschii]MCW1844006.1 DUF2336 domain-containing protein [Prosthecomicrobium hirschii]